MAVLRTAYSSFFVLLFLSFDIISASFCAHPGYDSGECSVRNDVIELDKAYPSGRRIIDITHAYREDMPDALVGLLRGSGSPRLARLQLKNGFLANNSEFEMPIHSGTHVDGPGHVYDEYFEAGFDVDTLDLGVLNGNYPCGRLNA